MDNVIDFVNQFGNRYKRELLFTEATEKHIFEVYFPTMQCESNVKVCVVPHFKVICARKFGKRFSFD